MFIVVVSSGFRWWWLPGDRPMVFVQ